MAILSLWALLCAYLLILLVFLPEWCVQLITEYFEWNEIDELFGMPVNTQKTRMINLLNGSYEGTICRSSCFSGHLFGLNYNLPFDGMLALVDYFPRIQGRKGPSR